MVCYKYALAYKSLGVVADTHAMEVRPEILKCNSTDAHLASALLPDPGRPLIMIRSSSRPNPGIWTKLETYSKTKVGYLFVLQWRDCLE